MTSGNEIQQLMTFEEALALLDTVLKQECLNDIQQLVLCQVWAGRTYPEIAVIAGYDTDYIKFVGSQLLRLISKAFGEKVTKSNVQSVVRRHLQQTRSVAIPDPEATERAIAEQLQDWGDALDVSTFYGRTQELATLVQWIVQDRCRLVALLGMGGIGKTALAAKLAEQIQGKFEYLIWRSLRNTQSIQDLLAELIQFLSHRQETDLLETVDARVLRLMECLRSSRCLLVLDNWESILREGDRTGCYREGYEGYGQLLRCVAETPHHSCLVLTSREKPRGLAAKEGETLPVRSLQLTGLPIAAGRKIFRVRGCFQASKDEWRVLIEHYAGNPLALKMVAPAIQDLFDSSISKFLELLKQGTFVSDDIRNLLDRQFNRLSDLEKEVMYRLAIKREPLSFLELQAYFAHDIRGSEILEALASLQRRCLIDKATPTLIENNMYGFTQQPVVMEYVTERLIEQDVTESATVMMLLS